MAETIKTAPQMEAKAPKTGQLGAVAPSVTEQAMSAGRDIKDKAADLAGASAEIIKTQASDFVDAAKDIASQTGDKVKQAVDDQRGAGAQYVGNLAGSLRRAAHEFEADLPIAASYIRKAASQVESVSDTVRNGNFNDLVQGAQSFARRQPTAFLGLSVLAGFGVIRFLKSTAGTGNQHGNATNSQSVDREPSAHSTTSHSDNRGYRDEFTR